MFLDPTVFSDLHDGGLTRGPDYLDIPYVHVRTTENVREWAIQILADLRCPLKKIIAFSTAGQADQDSSLFAIELGRLSRDPAHADQAFFLLQELSKLDGERGSKRMLAAMVVHGEVGPHYTAELSYEVLKRADAYRSILHPSVVARIRRGFDRTLEPDFKKFMAAEGQTEFELAEDIVLDTTRYGYASARLIEGLHRPDKQNVLVYEHKLLVVQSAFEQYCRSAPEEATAVMFGVLELGVNRQLFVQTLAKQDAMAAHCFSVDGNVGAIILHHTVGALQSPLYQGLILPCLLEATLGSSQENSFLLSQLGECLRDQKVPKENFLKACRELNFRTSQAEEYYSDLCKRPEVLIGPVYLDVPRKKNRFTFQHKHDAFASNAIETVARIFPDFSQEFLSMLYRETMDTLSRHSWTDLIAMLRPIFGEKYAKLMHQNLEVPGTKSDQAKLCITKVSALYNAVRINGDRDGKTISVCISEIHQGDDLGRLIRLPTVLRGKGTSSSKAELLKALDVAVNRNDTVHARIKAVDVLKDDENDIAVETLVTLLQEPNREVREAALKGLDAYRIAKLSTVLTAELSSEFEEVRTGVASLFCDPFNKPILQDALKNQCSKVRQIAISKFVEVEDVAVLARSLNSEFSNVRSSAIRGLIGHDDKKVFYQIVSALDDPNAGVVLAALTFLKDTNDTAVLCRLINLFAHPRSDIRHAAIEICRGSEDPKLWFQLVSALSSAIENRSWGAARALWKTKDPLTISKVKTILRLASDKITIKSASYVLEKGINVKLLDSKDENAHR